MAKFSIDRFAMRTRIDCPKQRAAMYLKRIVALTGARRVCGDTYFLKAGGKRFLLDNSAVRLISHRGKSTCFSIPAHPYMPRQEVIASALLQLKNNPKLFKKWRKRPGYLFRANGKAFRTDRLFVRQELW
ncbi:MAG: hypothetical protein JWO71_2164 [Candidatus Acidoferrum typicum]|nr:hypothetical protein [Candidatus Acidoferrum typicum]